MNKEIIKEILKIFLVISLFCLGVILNIHDKDGSGFYLLALIALFIF